MAEYIERETVKALFDERYDSAFMQMHTRDNKEHWNGVCAGVNWGRNTIADAPTADVAEVVRCKECKYCREDICAHPKNIAHSWDEEYYIYDHYIYVGSEHFCSYGERSDT